MWARECVCECVCVCVCVCVCARTKSLPVIRLWAIRPGFRFPEGVVLLFPETVHTSSGALRASCSVCAEGSFCRVKRWRVELTITGSRAEVKNGWGYSSTFPIRLHGLHWYNCILTNLTFRGLCIVVYSYKKPTRCTNFSNLFWNRNQDP